MVLQYAIDKIQSCDNIYTVKSIANSVNSNQIKNKKWLLKHLKPYLDMYVDPKIVVAAGWHGLTAHLINKQVVSFDQDPTCAKVKLFPNVSYQTSQIEVFDPSEYNIIICTSCEHISDKVLNDFLAKKNAACLVVLQSNNYYGIPEHINCKQNCNEFADSINFKILDKLTLKCHKYNRFMVFAI